MARVQGMKEKLHMPQYDAFHIQPPEPNRGLPGTFEHAMATRGDARLIRFFVDVQNKTRLETNLQSAGVLPSQNSFDARALRVVVSTLPEEQDTAQFVSELIYSSVTSLLVGEKLMIEVPTYYFPSGAGVFGTNGNAALIGHGEPDPLATFRFAEPVIIEPQQNFRVEMAFPQGVPATVAEAHGDFRMWVVLDGYLTRDVQ